MGQPTINNSRKSLSWRDRRRRQDHRNPRPGVTLKEAGTTVRARAKNEMQPLPGTPEGGGERKCPFRFLPSQCPSIMVQCLPCARPSQKPADTGVTSRSGANEPWAREAAYSTRNAIMHWKWKYHTTKSQRLRLQKSLAIHLAQSLILQVRLQRGKRHDLPQISWLGEAWNQGF